MITTIPLSKLVASERNVRRRGEEQADLELKADIAARGLLQNLVVKLGGFRPELGRREFPVLRINRVDLRPR